MSQVVLIEIKACELNYRIVTAYGRITRLEWLKKECERILATGSKAEIVHDDKGCKLIVETNRLTE